MVAQLRCDRDSLADKPGISKRTLFGKPQNLHAKMIEVNQQATSMATASTRLNTSEQALAALADKLEANIFIEKV